MEPEQLSCEINNRIKEEFNKVLCSKEKIPEGKFMFNPKEVETKVSHFLNKVKDHESIYGGGDE